MDLKTLRITKGFSQQEIAKAVGLSRAAYTNIENGKRNLTVKTAKKLGIILDIPWYQLIDNKKVS